MSVAEALEAVIEAVELWEEREDRGDRQGKVFFALECAGACEVLLSELQIITPGLEPDALIRQVASRPDPSLPLQVRP